jgi:hypothetical protein
LIAADHYGYEFIQSAKCRRQIQPDANPQFGAQPQRIQLTERPLMGENKNMAHKSSTKLTLAKKCQINQISRIIDVPIIYNDIYSRASNSAVNFWPFVEPAWSACAQSRC